MYDIISHLMVWGGAFASVPPYLKTVRKHNHKELPMKRINISTKKHPDTFAIVDDEDYDFLNQWKWLATKGGNSLYVQRTENKKSILMHRLIMGETNAEMFIDHINGNPLDNQRSNLRFATRSQNLGNTRNTKLKNKNGFAGVLKREHNLFAANIRYDGKQRFIGNFKTAELAHEAYKKKHIEVHGEFSKYYDGATV